MPFTSLLADEPPEPMAPYRAIARLQQRQGISTWRGLDPQEQPVFLKCFAPSQLSAYRRELAAGLGAPSPRLVALLDTQLTADNGLLVYEWLDGGSLETHLATHGPLSPGDWHALMAALFDGLAALHAQGVIHCDVKPANLLYRTTHGDPRRPAGWVLADLGAICPRREAATHRVGTPAYSAPERLRDGGDERADLYSAGVLGYEALLGQRPFYGPPAALFHAHRQQLPELSILPPRYRALIGPWLAKSPDHRPASALIAAQQLAAVAQATPPFAARAPGDEGQLHAVGGWRRGDGAVHWAWIRDDRLEDDSGVRAAGLTAYQFDDQGLWYADATGLHHFDGSEVPTDCPDLTDTVPMAVHGRRVAAGAQSSGMPTVGIQWAWFDGNALYFQGDGRCHRQPQPDYSGLTPQLCWLGDGLLATAGFDHSELVYWSVQGYLAARTPFAAPLIGLRAASATSAWVVLPTRSAGQLWRWTRYRAPVCVVDQALAWALDGAWAYHRDAEGRWWRHDEEATPRAVTLSPVEATATVMTAGTLWAFCGDFALRVDRYGQSQQFTVTVDT